MLPRTSATLLTLGLCAACVGTAPTASAQQPANPSSDGYGLDAQARALPAQAYANSVEDRAEIPSPKTTDWEEGEPVPPGYRAVPRSRTDLVVAGSVTAGSLWLTSATAGAAVNAVANSISQCGLCNPPDRDAGKWLLVPLIGPFGELTHSTSAGESAVLIIDGIGQVVGAAILISGFAIPKTILVRDHGNLSVTPLPFVGRSLAGLGVVGTF